MKPAIIFKSFLYILAGLALPFFVSTAPLPGNAGEWKTEAERMDEFTLKVSDTSSGLCEFQVSFDEGITWTEWQEMPGVCFRFKDCAGNTSKNNCFQGKKVD